MFKKYLRYFSNQTKIPQRITAVLVIIAVAAIGTYLLTGSKAASPYANVNVANGSLGGNAQKVQNCSGANSGSCVTFGCGSTGTAITVCPGTSHNLSPDFFGFNGDGPDEAWADSNFTAAVQGLNPETIRGPLAGTPSNYLNWQTGRYFIDSQDPNLFWITPSQPATAYHFSDYVNALKDVNGDGVFVLNIMTYCPDPTQPGNTSMAAASCATPADACGPNPSLYTTSCTSSAAHPTWGLDYQVAMLQQAQSLMGNKPIQKIELGNEFYDTSNADFTYYFPTVQDYINKVNAWIPTLKQDFPQARIAVVGDAFSSCRQAPNQPPPSSQTSWSQAIESGVHGEDAIVFHTYYDSNIASGGSISNPQSLSDLLSAAAQVPQGSLPTDYPTCFSNLQNYELSHLPSGVKAWITEWNLWSDKTVLAHGSWAQGLSEAEYALNLANDPRIELADTYTLLGDQVWGTLFDDVAVGNAPKFGYVASSGAVPSPLPIAQALGKSAGGYALSSLLRSLHGATSTASLSFSTTPTIANSAAPGLLGQSFIVNGKTNLFFANLSPTAETINLGNLSGNYLGQQYVSSPTDFITGIANDSSIPLTSFPATTTVTIPAYSVTSLVSP
jgi:hypothetical protein